MKLLYLTLEPPLDTAKVATGNQVRVKGIREVLEAAGHQVHQLAFRPEASDVDANDTQTPNTAIERAGTTPDVPLASSYQSAEQLHAIIAREPFDAIIVAYWYLLDHLPESTIPVVLDFIAPRLLEIMFQAPESVAQQAREIIRQLSRIDHVLAGNQRQADLLLPLLLQAGIDCRHQVPISLVPISARSKLDPVELPQTPLKLVNAGVDWPWRDFSRYKETLEALAAGNQNLSYIEYTGIYPGLLEQDGESDSPSTLQSYAAMQSSLQQCHIGLELGERNPEREFSHSFRAMEYLESGLPIIINSWIPLATLIKQYDAGWVIDDASELEALLERLLSDPGLLAEKRSGVNMLKAQQLNYQHACKPLLDYLSAPTKAHRFALKDELPVEPQVQETQEIEDVEETIEAFQEPQTSSMKILLGTLFKRYFCPTRPDSTPDVLMVTRSDLFPVDHGAAVKIIRTAEAISRTGRDVWLMTDSRAEYFQFTDGEMQTHRYPFLLRFLCQPRSVAFMKLMKMGFPYTNSFLYMPVTDASYIVRAIYLTSRKPVGAYQAEFPAYVRPCRYARSLFGGKILLVQHNVEYDRIRNQEPDLTANNIQTLKNLELAMCHEADNIVAVSDNDRNKMIADGIAADKIHTIPHGVDLQAFHTTPLINIREHYRLPWQTPVLVYHGTYSYSPNLDAMRVMAKEILPRLKARNLQVTVLAIGSKPPDFPLHPDIIFVGSVGDLAEVLPAADLAVVTLQDGGGTRMKILDYFAAGVPVISTTKGIEGIPVENGKEALIIDDFDAISEAIVRLLGNPEEAKKLSDNAALFVDALGWDAIGRRYLPLLH